MNWSALGDILLALGFGIVLFGVVQKSKKKNIHIPKSAQDQMWENQINALQDNATEDDVIRIYESIKRSGKKPHFDVVVALLSKLIQIGAFPKEVTEWLSDPRDYELEGMIAVMNEYVAWHTGNLKDAVAMCAYVDGFIPAYDVTRYVNPLKYPKTMAAFKVDPENYDTLRELALKEEKSQKALPKR